MSNSTDHEDIFPPRGTRQSRANPRSPRGWWQGTGGRVRAQEETRRMLNELGWSELAGEEIALRLTYRTFSAYGLGKMLDIVYGSSPYAALRDLFPKLKPWQMKQTPNRYWQNDEGREHARAATRWLIGQLGLVAAEPEEVAAVVDQSTFDRAGLRGMLEIVYSDSPYAALADLYPDLHPWQMAGGSPSAYWAGKSGRDHARAATRWMLAQMGLREAEPVEIARQVTGRTFEVHGLIGMLSRVYSDSPYRALKDVYSHLRPQDMARAPRSYELRSQGWDYLHDHARAQAATRWVIAQLGLQEADPVAIAELIDEGIFDPVHLAVMLGHDYSSDGGKTHTIVHTQSFSEHPPRDLWLVTGNLGSQANNYR